MKLKKTILIVVISIFHSFSSLSLAKAQTSFTTSTIEKTTTERRNFDGDLPTSPEVSEEEKEVPGADLCKTESEEEKKNSQLGSQRIELHYVRDAVNIVDMLQKIKDKLALNNLEVYHRSEVDNEIILYGPKKERKCAYRIIAAIDLPRPGINMQMWGIQISTDRSSGQEALNEVMPKVRDRINLTQQLVRDTFAAIQAYSVNQIDPDKIDSDFKSIVEQLEYNVIFARTRPLSLLDIVIIANSSKNPDQFSVGLFKELMKIMKEDDRYKPYLEAMQKKGRPPFDSFFRSRGLKPQKYTCQDSAKRETEEELPKENTKSSSDKALKIESDCWRWEEISKNAPVEIARQNRRLILEFGLQYGDFISNPHLFSPYELQQTSDALNGRLQDTTNALQKDIEEFFMLPTLNEIQEIVSEEKSITYAQLGRTTAATLSGVETKIGTNSVSAFDVTPPLKLSDLLTKASELQGQITDFIPTETVPGADAAKQIAVDSALPVSKVIGLIAAFAEQDPVFRELETGISLNFTPNILRDLSSSELKINLSITDPVASPTEQEGVEPLSRIGKQTVETTVYTQAIDFFALSTFSNQSTLNGGRGYVPIIGQIWRGIFSAIPVFGNLFSWQRPPQNVQHESLLLTNSFITPTSIGLALLYPTSSDAYEREKFCQLQAKVDRYIEKQEKTTHNSQEIIFIPEEEQNKQNNCINYRTRFSLM